LDLKLCGGYIEISGATSHEMKKFSRKIVERRSCQEEFKMII
jgi:hypothetical protein